MILKTTLLGKTYTLRDLKQVLAKANEEKSGDKLAGLAAENAQERIAAKVVLSAVTLRELRPGAVKVSVRSGPRVDACALCRELGGGGHHAAAGATVNGTLDEARMAVLAAYRKVTGA